MTTKQIIEEDSGKKVADMKRIGYRKWVVLFVDGSLVIAHVLF
jgi:hypothetical protein